MGLGILSLAAKILADIHSTSTDASHQWKSESESGRMKGNKIGGGQWHLNDKLNYIYLSSLDPVVKHFAGIHATSSPEEIVPTFQNW